MRCLLALLLALSLMGCSSKPKKQVFPSPSRTPGPESILPEQAPSRVGKRVIVQGKVVSVKNNAEGFYYINFGKDPQNQPFRALVFPGDTGKFTRLRELAGHTVKVRGMLRNYRGRTMIQLVSPKQIELVK